MAERMCSAEEVCDFWRGKGWAAAGRGEQTQASLQGGYGPSGNVEQIVRAMMELAEIGVPRGSAGADEVLGWRRRGELMHQEADLLTYNGAVRWREMARREAPIDR